MSKRAAPGRLPSGLRFWRNGTLFAIIHEQSNLPITKPVFVSAFAVQRGWARLASIKAYKAAAFAALSGVDWTQDEAALQRGPQMREALERYIVATGCPR